MGRLDLFTYAIGATFFCVVVFLFGKLIVERENAPQWMAPAGELAAAAAIARLSLTQHMTRRHERDLDRMRAMLERLERE